MSLDLPAECGLEHQRQLHSRNGRDNLQTLFGAIKIPSDNQIRNILDKIKANSLFVVFSDIYQLLTAILNLRCSKSFRF
ncbi:MAG: hypothetical protein KA717_04310 [Woronichinia naegeliana WA131]|uniref:Uncharacterized protein n=1 Tax=Woronichinia naegeliana WA131 TaxID=2824559 RepID=A0A977KXE6_9CYAN|nr:MAG: hypothetical protein KA717_01460 [Woronichinia naegeliana WA131]UXE62087.1 MAG: hypothetical protein KA717_04310 [Woronichinia naegeliana WA131]